MLHFIKRIGYLILFYYLFINQVIASGDRYESDNNMNTATLIQLYDPDTGDQFDIFEIIQQHNMFDEDDEDWFIIDVSTDVSYMIEVIPDIQTGYKCDPFIEIYESDGVTLIKKVDQNLEGKKETIDWLSDYRGIVYARVGQCNPDNVQGCAAKYGANTNYKIILSKTSAGGFGYISGTILSCQTDMDFNKLKINTSYQGKEYAKASIIPTCKYLITVEEGSYLLNAFIDTVNIYSQQVEVKALQVSNINITASSEHKIKGDINNNKRIDIEDVILLLYHVSK